MGMDGVTQYVEGRDGCSCISCDSKFEKQLLFLTCKGSRDNMFSSLWWDSIAQSIDSFEKLAWGIYYVWTIL